VQQKLGYSIASSASCCIENGDGQPKRFGGLEVDDQIELGWRLHGEVGRLGALENAVDVCCRFGKLFGKIAAISDQAA
jgi:hypothetical protein